MRENLAAALAAVLWAPSAVTQASPAASPVPVATPTADPCTVPSNLITRPTVSTSACAVATGGAVLETGYTNATTHGAGGSNAVAYPQAELRAGLARHLEVDVEPPSYERSSSFPGAAGTSDASAGFSYTLGETSTVIYGVNVLGTFDSGSQPFTGNGDGVVFNANGELTLSPAVGLFGTFGYTSQSAGTAIVPAHYHAFAPSLGVLVSLPASFTYFLEGFGQTSPGIGLGGRYGFDTGVTRLIGSRFRLDAEISQVPPVRDAAVRSSVGFGAAYIFGP